MNYYQARIAIDTAELLEELKKIYEEKSGVTITKGNVVMRAYEDSLWVTDWKEIYSQRINLENHYEISPNALKLRIQISEEVEQGIKDLRDVLKKKFELRSVTIGVCLRMIFKAAYLKNTDKLEPTINNISKTFDKYKEEARSIFKSDTLEEVIRLLDRLKDDLE